MRLQNGSLAAHEDLLAISRVAKLAGLLVSLLVTLCNLLAEVVEGRLGCRPSGTRFLNRLLHQSEHLVAPTGRWATGRMRERDTQAVETALSTVLGRGRSRGSAGTMPPAELRDPERCQGLGRAPSSGPRAAIRLQIPDSLPARLEAVLVAPRAEEAKNVPLGPAVAGIAAVPERVGRRRRSPDERRPDHRLTVFCSAGTDLLISVATASCLSAPLTTKTPGQPEGPGARGAHRSDYHLAAVSRQNRPGGLGARGRQQTLARRWRGDGAHAGSAASRSAMVRATRSV